MSLQRTLRLESRALEGLWKLIPEEHRQSVEALLGHLVAQAAREAAMVLAKTTKEERDERAEE